MIKLLLAIIDVIAKPITKAVTYVAAFFSGRLYERAKAIKSQKDADTRANDVANRVALDDDYRERVRNHFDNP